MSKLNIKQLAFIDDYIITGNATLSYAKVYKCNSIEGAQVSASKLLLVPMVALELEQRKRIIRAKYELTVQTQIAELDAFIESCVKEGLDGKGVIKDRNNWMKAIAEKNRLAGLITNKTKNENQNNNSITIDFNLDATTNQDNTEA